jgi:hypothetical protein
MFLSTGNPGSGDPGSGTDPFGGTGGPTLSQPPWTGVGCNPFTDPNCNATPGNLAGCDPSRDPTCGVTGQTGVAGSGTAGSGTAGSGCTLWNPTTWTGCILRFVILLLGIIAVIGGIYLLKPAMIEKPLGVAKKTAETAAAAAAVAA